MRPSIFMAVLLAVFGIVLASSCGTGGSDCDAESDGELCGERCGSLTLVDSCGEQRDLECGECEAGEDCQNNQCICEPDDEETLCAQMEAQCGVYNILDNCGNTRQIQCGECTSPDECVDGMCRCETAESNQDLCDAGGLECGEATVQDSCGEERQLECGSCSGPEECEDNQCICEGESSQQLCDAQEGACGTLELTDRCGASRTVDCGPCSEGNSTLGVVRDAATGELLQGAEVRIYTWPPSGGAHYSWFWTEGFRFDDPDLLVTTDAGSQGGVNFELSDNGGLCTEVQGGALEERQWYRFYIEHSGYRAGVFYRNHDDLINSDCPASCPASAASGCHRMEFELWPDDMAHPEYPSFFVDPRDLEDFEWQCALLPEESTEDKLMGLRVRLGAANIGQGPLHLQATPGDDGEGEVLQHVTWSDGSQESHVVESGTFEYFDDHNHIHFMNWFRMSLVEPVDECRDIDTRSADCVTDDGIKISYCLHDLDPFDGDVMNLYGGSSAMFLNPPTCDTTEQGVTQGWKDTYARGLPGQVIILGTPDVVSALGEQWIEAEVDPDRVLQEADRTGNVARKLVEAPADAELLCSPALALDCSGPPSSFDAAQRRQCRDYLRAAEP